MRLAIDVGNTLTKLAVFDQDKMIALQRHQDLNKAILGDIFREYDQISAGILSTVRNTSADIIEYIADQISLICLTHQTRLPISIEYDTPETLGMDRIAAVVGARHLFPDKNLLVIETGTCFTYDFIDGNGVYRGGSISPGMELRFTALHNFTDKLPLVEPVKDVALTGKTTETSIQSGVINGLIAEIQGVIAMYEGNYEKLTIILSGGKLDYFDKNLKNNIFAVPNIVLTGLNIILDFNDKN